MCNLVLTTPLNHIEDYRHLLDCLMCVYLNFALREWDFVPDVHKKVRILLPLACDLNLVITFEASRVVNSCSFTGIILFPYFNSTKELKKQWRVEIVAYARQFLPFDSTVQSEYI